MAEGALEGECVVDTQQDVERLFHIMCSCRPIALKHAAISRQGEVMVMRQLAIGKQMTPGQLAHSTSNSPGRISAILGALENKGWVVREVDPHNRRRVLVSLTDEGRHSVDAHRKVAAEYMAWVFDHMGADNTERFLQLLAEFMTYLSLLDPGKPVPAEDRVEALFVQRYQELIGDPSPAATHASPDAMHPADCSAAANTESHIRKGNQS